MLKRIFDVTACAISLIVLAPVFVILAVIVRLDSTGPVFYRGVRAGMNGTQFKILKFRTMVRDAELLGNGTTALNDFRITRAGRFLRKYKLDELPQLINVLLGDMSIVGPRPELLEYAAKYVGDELLILSIRPGITDYSSIKYSSLDELVGEVDAGRVFDEEILPERTALRLKYVRERTFWLDVKLIMLTIVRVAGIGRRAEANSVRCPR